MRDTLPAIRDTLPANSSHALQYDGQPNDPAMDLDDFQDEVFDYVRDQLEAAGLLAAGALSPEQGVRAGRGRFRVVRRLDLDDV